jgi:hypothetical protein
MRHLIVLAALVTALVASQTASAGGWATVGFAPLPTGLGPGDPWNPDITILQHGRTPLDGLYPTVTIRRAESGEAQTFDATPTGEPGVYTTEVVFSRAGSWGIVVESGFGDSNLTYGPVEIVEGGGAAAGSSDDGSYAVPVLVLVGALTLGGIAAFGVVRQRRLGPAG